MQSLRGGFRLGFRRGDSPFGETFRPLDALVLPAILLCHAQPLLKSVNHLVLSRLGDCHIRSIPLVCQTSSDSSLNPTLAPLKPIQSPTLSKLESPHRLIHTFCIFWSCRSYRVWVKLERPKEAPTIISKNGIPNKEGCLRRRE